MRCSALPPTWAWHICPGRTAGCAEWDIYTLTAFSQWHHWADTRRGSFRALLHHPVWNPHKQNATPRKATLCKAWAHPGAALLCPALCTGLWGSGLKVTQGKMCPGTWNGSTEVSFTCVRACCLGMGCWWLYWYTFMSWTIYNPWLSTSAVGKVRYPLLWGLIKDLLSSIQKEWLMEGPGTGIAKQFSSLDTLFRLLQALSYAEHPSGCLKDHQATASPCLLWGWVCRPGSDGSWLQDRLKDPSKTKHLFAFCLCPHLSALPGPCEVTQLLFFWLPATKKNEMESFKPNQSPSSVFSVHLAMPTSPVRLIKSITIISSHPTSPPCPTKPYIKVSSSTLDFFCSL